MRDKAEKVLGRRGFVKTVIGGSAAAAAATAIGAAGAAESVSDKKKARYRETEHVKKYYQTNRY